LRIVAALCLLGVFAGGASAQVDDQLTAKRRLFPGIGPGLHAIKRGAGGHYYVLASPTVGLGVFDAQGKQLKVIGAPPPAPGVAKEERSPIAFGEDCDVDAEGRMYVADHGSNLISIFSPEGNLLHTIPVNAPVSVAALPDQEVAVATMREPHLVIVFDKNGRDVREFGDPEAIAARNDLNRFLSVGRLLTDAAGHLYFGFEYLPEPTVRQYDRNGYARQDFQFTGLDAMPQAQAIRREIERQERRGDTPSFKRNLTAFGVDRATGEVWMALHNTLLHFDKEGNRKSSYLLYTPEGARLEANTILVEDDRLLIGSDPLGIYEFDRPDKKR
jgi:hypothetical protein